MKAEGFVQTRLLLTEGKARRSLVKRVAAANNLAANLFLSIHHNSVPNKFLEDWEFEGKKRHFSDRFSGSPFSFPAGIRTSRQASPLPN